MKEELKKELKKVIGFQEQIVRLGSQIMLCNVMLCIIFGFWTLTCLMFMVVSWGYLPSIIWAVGSAICSFLFGKEALTIKDRSQMNKANKSKLEHFKRMLDELEPEE